jgi:hypothetical protein
MAVDATEEKLMCVWDREKTTVAGKKLWNCGFCFCTHKEASCLPASIPKRVRESQCYGWWEKVAAPLLRDDVTSGLVPGTKLKTVAAHVTTREHKLHQGNLATLHCYCSIQYRSLIVWTAHGSVAHPRC